MRKFIIVAIIILCIIAAMVVPNMVKKANHYVHITNLDFKATIVDEKSGDKGKVLITERITYDVHARNRNDKFWEFWRDLPEETVDGVKTTYSVKSVKQITPDGQPDIVFSQASQLFWDDSDYISTLPGLGPNHWYHSEGPYNESLRQYECVLFYVEGIYRDTVTFEVEYEMFNASLRYADCSVINLLLYADKDAKYLDSVKGQIVFPNGKMPSDGNYQTFTYGTTAHTFNNLVHKSVDAVSGDTTFAFELNKKHLKFKPYNSHIEFALVAFGSDKHIFTQHASLNTYSNSLALSEILGDHAAYMGLAKKFKGIKTTLVIILSGLAALSLFSVFAAKASIKKKYTFYKTRYGHLTYYRDIAGPLDATFASALAFCKHKLSDNVPGAFSAAMLGLVSKGYISIDRFNTGKDFTPDNTRVTLIPDPDVKDDGFNVRARRAHLTQSETLVYNLFSRHIGNGTLSLQAFQAKVGADCDNTYSFVEELKELVKSIGMTEGYFQTPDYKKVKKAAMKWSLGLTFIGIMVTFINFFIWRTRLDFAFGAFFILGGGLIGAAILTKILFGKCVLLTQFGEDEYSKWRALYRFMKSRSPIKSEAVAAGNLDDYLIYATAFGVSEKVIASLEVKFPQLNKNDAPVFYNPYVRSISFRSYGHSFRSTTRRASFTSRNNARSGGYGGGYSSGGRGGGGGG